MFVSELKRRGVVTVAAIYIVSVWVVLQVADILFPAWNIAAQNIRLFVYAAILGFPIALVFGWRYDITAGGIVRTPSATEDERERLDRSLTSLDFVTLGALVLATMAIGGWLVSELTTSRPEAPTSPPNSVAVLPFQIQDDEVADYPDVADHLVSTLINIEGLNTTGRNSSFYFRDSSEPLDRIGGILGVRHLVTGSLSTGPSGASISVQLVRVPDLTPVWADTYTATKERLGDVVHEIGSGIAAAMQINVLDSDRDRISAQFADDPGLTTLVRLSNLKAENGDWDAARGIANEAVDTFPESITAWVHQARLYLLIYSSTATPTLVELQRIVTKSLDTAAMLGADSADYHYARALQARRQIRTSGSTPPLEKMLEDSFERAIARNPSDAQPYVSYSIHVRRKREFTRAANLLETALDYDPLHSGAIWQYSRVLSAFERHDEALTYAMRLPEYFDFGQQAVSDIYYVAGRLDNALEWQRANRRLDDLERWKIAMLWAQMLAPEEAQAALKTVREDDTLVPVAQSLIDALNGNVELAYERLARFVDDTGTQDPRVIRHAVSFALRLGRYEEAVRLTEHSVPGLRDPVAPYVDEPVAIDALNLAYALMHLPGNEVRAGILSTQVLDTTRGRPRTGWDGIGVRDAMVFAYQGDTERAIAAVRAAYESGWRQLYDEIGMLPPPLESLAGTPEFDEIVGVIERDLLAMRERSRAHHD